MRRRAPRRLSLPLEAAARRAAPPTRLAAVQRAWAAVAGERVARESEPVGDRDGIVTVACRSAVWAQELELLSGELLERLNAMMPASGGGSSVRRLRFVTRSGAGTG